MLEFVRYPQIKQQIVIRFFCFGKVIKLSGQHGDTKGNLKKTNNKTLIWFVYSSETMEEQ